MTAPVCFVDCETTGLDPDRHEIWEVGLITPDGEEHHWFLPVDESKADPFALEVGRYWTRYPRFTDGRGTGYLEEVDDFAEQFQLLTAGLHLAGAVVSFDEERLRKLLLRAGYLPRWHYHLVDVEALAAGYLARHDHGVDPGTWEPPWDSTELSLAVGVDPALFERHTALGDSRWSKAIYDAVMGTS